jgi:hypothetical protein
MPRLIRPIDYRGAVVNIEAGITRLQSKTRKRLGLPRVNPSIVPALLDTGANTSAIDPDLAIILQLRPASTTRVHTPTSGELGEDRSLYQIRLSFVEPEDILISDSMFVVGCDRLTPNGYFMLLGRDILDGCEFLYDGPRGEFSLTY